MKYRVLYQIASNTLSGRREFNIFAHGRRDASQVALEQLQKLYPDLSCQVTRCSRKSIIVSGLDGDGDAKLIAYINLLTETED